jgi:hypothetical protein
MKKLLPAALTFLAVGAVPAAAQPAPTPVEQRVVAPSLPDQPNKEGVARPSGSVPTDSEGNVQTNRGPVDPAKPAAGSAVTAKGAPDSGPAVLPAVPTPPPGPSGPADVKAAYLTFRGKIKAYEKGVSVTIVEKGGLERTVALAPKASVYDGIAVGDDVALRIPLGNPANGKSADRVSKQELPKAAPKSKFAAAQSPVR